MVKKHPACKQYKVDAGRVVVCKETGKELFHIGKEEGFSPTEADAMCHYIVNLLNKKKDFKKFYEKYMRS